MNSWRWSTEKQLHKPQQSLPEVTVAMSQNSINWWKWRTNLRGNQTPLRDQFSPGQMETGQSCSLKDIGGLVNDELSLWWRCRSKQVPGNVLSLAEGIYADLSVTLVFAEIIWCYWLIDVLYDCVGLCWDFLIAPQIICSKYRLDLRFVKNCQHLSPSCHLSSTLMAALRTANES